MTNATIQAMEAGRRLDGLVAKEIMGIEVEYPFAEGYPFYLTEDIKGKKNVWNAVAFYSADISAAFQVAEKMEWHEFYIHNEYHSGELYWYCGIEQPEDLGEGYFSTTARTLPEAICKAALLAKLNVSIGLDDTI